ncbi:peptidoglycan-binding protein [Clostridium sp. P21]|uniref:Peptidoglycan-binding protein n=1 Tax=Clostridium muellerianum TaxID=2716538 RepID=A0A7Y0EDI8_9CLOT|nr:peptidoglycan-binding protein [Clostridium muellerianum]NMM61509.1 peptidoglycan-binding protein [Clostridium muellerianum]
MKSTNQVMIALSLAMGITLGTNKHVYAQGVSIKTINKQDQCIINKNFNRIVKFGDKGNIVKQIQSALNLYNGAGLVEDSIYGKDTKEAVQKLQRKLHIHEDGIFGPTTAKGLLSYNNKFSVDDNNGFTPVSTDIQKQMMDLGYNIKANGDLNSVDTVEVVKRIQKENNMKITGKVDELFISKIQEEIKRRLKETQNFESDTNYYILVNLDDHVCTVYRRTRHLWKKIRVFNIVSSDDIQKGNYKVGIKGKNLSLNYIDAGYFTQITGLDTFYYSKENIGFGLRVSKEDAEFINQIPTKTTIKIF